MKFTYKFHRWLDQNEISKLAFVMAVGAGLFFCLIPFKGHAVASLVTLVLYMAGVVFLALSRINYLQNK